MRATGLNTGDSGTGGVGSRNPLIILQSNNQEANAHEKKWCVPGVQLIKKLVNDLWSSNFIEVAFIFAGVLFRNEKIHSYLRVEVGFLWRGL